MKPYITMPHICLVGLVDTLLPSPCFSFLKTQSDVNMLEMIGLLGSYMSSSHNCYHYSHVHMKQIVKKVY